MRELIDVCLPMAATRRTAPQAIESTTGRPVGFATSAPADVNAPR
jgi:hypothetical protein